VRVTGGDWRGRRLDPLKGFKGRPTTDFAREGLFNLLRSRVDIHGAKVLDLFSGTGMVGVECASRGAASVTAIEKQRGACDYIKQSYSTLGYSEIVVLSTDVFKFLEQASQRPSIRYDFIFADPPYDLKQLETLPSRVKSSGLLDSDGLFVLEHGENNSFNGEAGFVERRKYGHVHFSFFTFES
jgi:16S rRNA (guanine(966)-N(2))-methyltransferase RsmD